MEEVALGTGLGTECLGSVVLDKGLGNLAGVREL